MLWIALALASTGCGPARARTAPTPGAIDYSRVYPLDAVYVLEMSGTPPADTTVQIPVGQERFVILRHGPPEELTFAEVHFPPEAFDTIAGRDSVAVTIRPRPGVYGLDIETTARLRAARVTFKYAVHFLAPAAARQRYGSDMAFERVLAIGRLDSSGVSFLPSTRPAADNLQAGLAGAGSYLVAAPR